MTRVFIIRPFGKKKDSSGKELDFERVQSELIEPALAKTNLSESGSTTGEIIDEGNIREDMFALILEADLVICDITIHNANVFYELGIRHAFRKKHTILMKGEPAADSPPFDLLTDRYMPYNIDNPATDQAKLINVIGATLQSERETDSPIFKMLPTLPEVDVSTVQVVPVDFREEVARARAAKSKGWLRLLAQDLRGRRFQWTGLQLVAQEQWKLMDYEGARESLETIRDVRHNDAAANLMLANIYERLYRSQKKPELLKASDQAIEQVLLDTGVALSRRMEALALKGRNQKTQWRREFENLGEVDQRRAAATNQALRECYEAYRKAFYQDLNHFYSGLNALQMGTILLDLSAGGNNSWKNAFDNDSEAATYRQKLEQEVEQLRLLVPASIEAGLDQLAPTSPDRIWAEISKPDILFLTEQNEQRVINRYKDVLPNDNPFAWDAAKGQLQLFAALGVKADLANAVIAALDKQFTDPQPIAEKPLSIVVFAGHRVDAPGRSEDRFPASREGRARELIRAALSELDQNYHHVGMASAAPGADILFHEVCDELSIPSKLCLPMPADDYARLVFEDLDDWRSRFFDLRDTKREILELSDREGLPQWLYGANTNPWERGNRWVLQMAVTSGAKDITLVALWDRKNEGDAPGGTAHMVQMARNTDRVDVKIIDTKDLLA
jgi:hypothetical protein